MVKFEYYGVSYVYHSGFLTEFFLGGGGGGSVFV